MGLGHQTDWGLVGNLAYMDRSAYFCQSLLIKGRVYCPMIKVDWLTAGVLPKSVSALSANPPSQ